MTRDEEARRCGVSEVRPRPAKMRSEGFIAVRSFSQRELDVLGSGFRRAFPLNDIADFAPLLRQIDEASRRS